MSGERLPLPFYFNEQPHSPNHPMNTSWPGQSQNNDGGQFQGVGHLEPNNSTNGNHVQALNHSNTGAYPYQQPAQQPVQGSSGNVRDSDNSTNANHVQRPDHSNSGAYPSPQPTQQPVQGSSGSVRDPNNSTKSKQVHAPCQSIPGPFPSQPTVQVPFGRAREPNNLTNGNYMYPPQHSDEGFCLHQQIAQLSVQRNFVSSSNANHVLPELSTLYPPQQPTQHLVQGPLGIVEDFGSSPNTNHVRLQDQFFPEPSISHHPQAVKESSEIVGYSDSLSNPSYALPQRQFPEPFTAQQPAVQGSSGIVGDYISAPNSNYIPLECLPGPSTATQDPTGNVEDENKKKRRKKARSLCRFTIDVYRHMTGRPFVSAWIAPTTNYNDSKWAQVLYHELNSKIADDFMVTSSSFIIDGLTAATDSDRYCLGAVSNVNRTEIAVRVMSQIGRGVKITRRGLDVDMTVRTVGELPPVFVQSATHAHAVGDHRSTVYRIANGNSMPIFNMAAFEALLAAKMNEGYSSVYKLQQELCHARISFVKGYGTEYTRKSIEQTPCWVQIQFLKPMQRIDKVLHTLKPPQNLVSSRS